MIAPGAFDCAPRIPPQLRDDVPGAELPADNSVGQHIAFGDAQTGQLDQANDEKGTVLWIVDNCEAERRAAVEQINGRSLLQRLTPWRE